MAFGAQKMNKPFRTKKAARVDRSEDRSGLTFFKNGAKETRTPAPLHAIRLILLPETKS